MKCKQLHPRSVATKCIVEITSTPVKCCQKNHLISNSLIDTLVVIIYTNCYDQPLQKCSLYSETQLNRKLLFGNRTVGSDRFIKWSCSGTIMYYNQSYTRPYTRLLKHLSVGLSDIIPHLKIFQKISVDFCYPF